jgi:uncharacterized coiled-coil DUF342 family protein
MVKKAGILGVVFASFLLVAGCGQQLKQENEQLKAQVTTFTEESNNLKNQVAGLQKEVDDIKAQLSGATAERDAARKELDSLKAKSASKGAAKKAKKTKKR